MATPQDLQLQVLIKSVADTTGFKLTTEQAQKLNDILATQAKKQEGVAQGAKGAKEQLGGLKEAGRGATEMFDGLTRASSGGIQSIFGVAQAFRGFLNVVRGAIGTAGPIGLLITGFGLLAGAALAFTRINRQVQASQEEVNAAMKRTSERAEELEKKRLSRFTNAVDDAVKSSQQLLANLEQTNALIDRLEKSKLGAQIAGIDANEGLNSAEKTAAKQKLLANYVSGQRTREDEVLSAKERTAADILNTRIAAQFQLGAQADDLKRRRTAVEEDRFGREQDISYFGKLKTLTGFQAGADMLTNDLPSLLGRLGLFNVFSGAKDRLEARQGAATSDDAARRASELEKNLQGVSAAAAAAEEATRTATELYQKAVSEVSTQRKFNAGIRASEDAATTISNREQLKDALKQDLENAPRRTVLNQLRGDSGLGLSTLDQERVASRAVEINKEALATAGQQVGEDLGGATLVALQEMAKSLTAAHGKVLREAIDRIVKQETATLEAQLKAQRN